MSETMTNTLPPPNTAPVPPRPQRRGLGFVILSAGLLLVGIGVAAFAVVESTGPDEVAVLVVDDRVSPSAPSTVAPVTAPPPTVRPSDVSLPRVTLVPTEAVVSTDPSGSTVPMTSEPETIPEAPPLSPLATQLGALYSVVPESITPRPQPIGLAIDSIDTADYPIRGVGLEADGELEVPDETEIGWYKYGATAGRPGATVLAAHVSWNNTTGPFYELGNVDPGDEITVTLDDGTERQYEVIERTMYDKSELPRERIWRNTGDETLVLITCGGDFNPDIRRYRQNIVVYAVPVA